MQHPVPAADTSAPPAARIFSFLPFLKTTKGGLYGRLYFLSCCQDFA